MAEATFYRCNRCGLIVAQVKAGHCVPQCCGEQMEKLVAGSVDAAAEKHVPAVTRDGNKLCVKVGEVEHPMLEAHYIEWIALATEDRVCIKYLKPGEAPEASFCLAEGVQGTVYAYCNLHGLWMAEA